jgi:hypothetical protein
MSTMPSPPHPWPHPSNEAPDVARLQRRLAPLLAVVMG